MVREKQLVSTTASVSDDGSLFKNPSSSHYHSLPRFTVLLDHW